MFRVVAELGSGNKWFLTSILEMKVGDEDSNITSQYGMTNDPDAACVFETPAEAYEALGRQVVGVGDMSLYHNIRLERGERKVIWRDE